MATFEIKTTVSTQDVLNMFEKAGRGNSFTYDGLNVILHHMENTTDEIINLDIIGIDCDYTECTLDEYLNDYGYNPQDYRDVGDIMNTIRSETWGIYLGDNKVVYLNY